MTTNGKPNTAKSRANRALRTDAYFRRSQSIEIVKGVCTGKPCLVVYEDVAGIRGKRGIAANVSRHAQANVDFNIALECAKAAGKLKILAEETEDELLGHVVWFLTDRAMDHVNRFAGVAPSQSKVCTSGLLVEKQYHPMTGKP